MPFTVRGTANIGSRCDATGVAGFADVLAMRSASIVALRRQKSLYDLLALLAAVQIL